MWIYIFFQWGKNLWVCIPDLTTHAKNETKRPSRSSCFTRKRQARIPFDNTLYLIPLYNYREENTTSPIAKVSTFLRSPNTSPPPLTPRKVNSGEIIANCCLDWLSRLFLFHKVCFGPLLQYSFNKRVRNPNPFLIVKNIEIATAIVFQF